jgi:hypothetical protein
VHKQRENIPPGKLLAVAWSWEDPIEPMTLLLLLGMYTTHWLWPLVLLDAAATLVFAVM